MSQLIHYVLADPSGNMTALVLDAVPAEERAEISTRLLRSDCVGAEQVGFLTMDQNKMSDLRIDMMGGEFCGNASRSAAAYAACSAGKETGEYTVSCSGCGTLLNAAVQRRYDAVYDAVITMPIPDTIETVELEVDRATRRFLRVALPGIVHFVFMEQGAAHVDADMYWQAVKRYAEHRGYAAYGLVLFDPVTSDMVPAVYVAETDTLYWEQSCGSGSAAAVAAASWRDGRDVSFKLKQPGGSISASAVTEGGTLQRITIGGDVVISPVRTIVI